MKLQLSGGWIILQLEVKKKVGNGQKAWPDASPTREPKKLASYPFFHFLPENGSRIWFPQCCKFIIL
jgi:hypothetical protein